MSSCLPDLTKLGFMTVSATAAKTKQDSLIYSWIDRLYNFSLMSGFNVVRAGHRPRQFQLQWLRGSANVTVTRVEASGSKIKISTSECFSFSWPLGLICDMSYLLQVKSGSIFSAQCWALEVTVRQRGWQRMAKPMLLGLPIAFHQVASWV